MDRVKVENEIVNIFSIYKSITKTDTELLSGLAKGKLYEFYVLSTVLTDLSQRGFQIALKFGTLKFKGAPGTINHTDPHFEITAPNRTKKLKLFVSIEFWTQGARFSQTLSVSGTVIHDYSNYHELDIALVEEKATGYPKHDEIFLAVECKSGKFKKNYVREVLGIRRELSLYKTERPSCLTDLGGKPAVRIRADPASEYWFAFIDKEGKKYRESPAEFGIDLRHIDP